MSKTRQIIIFVASIGVVIAAIMLLKNIIEYRQAESEYDTLSQYVSEGGAEAGEGAELNKDSVGEGAAVEPDGGSFDEEKTETKKELKRNYNRNDFPDIKVDFDALQKINSSCVAWLYVDGAQINYPVVQGTDNEFYLHHTFEMKKNSSGCVFMDWEVDPLLTSWNTFFYGHNMKNGTMFGHLKNFINNPANYEKDPYIYVFRPEGIYRYEIFSYYLDQTDSKMYYTCDSFSEYRAYLREATKKSVKECKARATADDNIVTLVTCSGSGANKQRFFVHGVFVDRYLYLDK